LIRGFNWPANSTHFHQGANLARIIAYSVSLSCFSKLFLDSSLFRFKILSSGEELKGIQPERAAPQDKAKDQPIAWPTGPEFLRLAKPAFGSG
jgi:hypothetical protein